MLARRNRLNKKEVQSALQKGSRFFVKGATLIVARSSIDHARFAVLVPKKIARAAHQRNKIRRIYYDCLSKYISSHSGKDVLVIPRAIPGSVKECQENLSRAAEAIRIKNCS